MNYIVRHVWGPKLDLIEQFVAAVAVEGRQSRDHLEDDGTEAPPVDRLAVSLFVQDFRSEILGGAAYGHRVVLVDVHLG